MQEKYIFTPESLYLQGILNDINEQDTFFLDCKHKHMTKSRAPPESRIICYQKNSMVSQAELISKGYHSVVPGLISLLYRQYGSL